MQYPDHGTSAPYYVDIIEICLAAKFLNSDEIKRLYLEEALSANQIASRFRVSRTVILSRLHQLGIRDGAGTARATNPENYRCRVPPYGFAVQNGKLVTNRKEMKICRLVVELVQRNGQGHTAVARELSQRGFKNRAGNIHWDSKTVFNILKRWKGKI